MEKIIDLVINMSDKDIDDVQVSVPVLFDHYDWVSGLDVWL